MPGVERDQDRLILDFSDLGLSKIIPWDILPLDQDAPFDEFRERVFDFLDALEAQRLAQKLELCMNIVDGEVCQARSGYVVGKNIFLCEKCWADYAADDSQKLERKKIEL